MEWILEFILFLQQFALWVAIFSVAGTVISRMMIILILQERKRAAEEYEDETQPP